MTTWLHSKNAEFTAWPGLKSMTFAKLDDTTIKSSVVYASLKDLEANQANFEVQPILFGVSCNLIIIFQSLGPCDNSKRGKTSLENGTKD